MHFPTKYQVILSAKKRFNKFKGNIKGFRGK